MIKKRNFRRSGDRTSLKIRSELDWKPEYLTFDSDWSVVIWGCTPRFDPMMNRWHGDRYFIISNLDTKSCKIPEAAKMAPPSERIFIVVGNKVEETCTYYGSLRGNGKKLGVLALPRMKYVSRR